MKSCFTETIVCLLPLFISTFFFSDVFAGEVQTGRKAWTDPVTGVEFNSIKGGCYMMGSPPGETNRYEDEVQHEVCVEDFWLGRYEVTNAQFSMFVEDKGYVTTSEAVGEGFGIGNDGAQDWGWKKGVDWKHPLWPEDTIADKSTHPVVQISWHDASAFLKWMTRKHDGKILFRLPSEAEWEYACRAGTTTARYWGNEPDQACQYAAVADVTTKEAWPSLAAHSCTDAYTAAAPVGQFEPNGWGLYDMLGNVWELTEDTYSQYSEPDLSAIVQDDYNPAQVIRGGSWIYGPAHVRCAFRNILSRTGRSYSAGFRIASNKIVAEDSDNDP